MKRACVFAHYDRDNVLADYVLYSLASLNTIVDKLIFVSTSQLGPSDLATIEEVCDELICRKNIGYDFYSYRVGLERLVMKEYDEVVILNDSIYGPLFDLKPLFSDMSDRNCDFWGMTDNHDLAFHLQSYFLVFKSAVTLSQIFREFWENLPVHEDKKIIVQEYEIGLSRALVDAGFLALAVRPSRSMGALKRILTYRNHYWRMFCARWADPTLYTAFFGLLGKKSGVNQTHWEWARILSEGVVPYLKVDLFRDDPDTQLGDREVAFQLIEENTQYPVDLIRKHLARLEKGNPLEGDDIN